MAPNAKRAAWETVGKEIPIRALFPDCPDSHRWDDLGFQAEDDVAIPRRICPCT
jgi:hypothetical protein